MAGRRVTLTAAELAGLVVPHTDFDRPTGNALVQARVGYGLSHVGSTMSARTPMLEVTPRILGPHGLWHTPDRHVGHRQKLPDYIEQVAGALMDQQGMDEQQAIATAINAIKRWAKGKLGWGRHRITPEVIAASRAALAEWNELKRSHH